MSYISCENLAVGYEGQAVASGISISVERGDYLCILGENGSGKSTLMKTILGLQEPLSGEIKRGDGLQKGEIGYLPQQTVVQKDFPASVQEIVRSGVLGRSKFRPFYTKEEKLQALSEAVRVTKPGGYILVAYCMNEPTIVSYVFGKNKLREVMGLNMLTPDWHCISEPKDLFEMVRTEEIAALDIEVPVKRIKLVATDGATNYMQDTIDAMDDETFGKWMDYHFSICERQDLIGASHHTLDILQKSEIQQLTGD